MRRAGIIVAALGWGVGPAIALGTPIKDDNSVGPKKWVDPIKVYIPPDPEPGRSRQNQIKAAVDAWVSKLAGQGTGLQISTVMLNAAGNDPATGMPPPAGGGSVTVSWVGDKQGEATTGTQGVPTGRKGKDDKGNEVDILKDQQHDGGKVQIKKGVTAFPANDADQALKIMMHEFGHILGLDHEKSKDSVMQDDLASYQELTGPGDSDLREIKSIYTASTGTLTPTVTPVPGGFRYAYTATWTGGGEIPLVQVVAPFSDAGGFVVPPGWEVLPPDEGWPTNIVHVRVAPTDGLSAYLNATNPSISFSFFSPMPPGETVGWVGGVVSTVGPVPEPAGCGLLAMGLFWRRRWTRNAWRCGY